MIKTSNQFLYSNKSLLPHTIHLQPYSPQEQNQIIPPQCSCGFYHNIYNQMNSNQLK